MLNKLHKRNSIELHNCRICSNNTPTFQNLLMEDEFRYLSKSQLQCSSCGRKAVLVKKWCLKENEKQISTRGWLVYFWNEQLASEVHVELWSLKGGFMSLPPTPRAAAAIKVKPRTTNQSRASIFSFLCSWCTQVIFPNCTVRVCPWVPADAYKDLGWIFLGGTWKWTQKLPHFVPTMSSELLNAAAWLCPWSPAQLGVALEVLESPKEAPRACRYLPSLLQQTHWGVTISPQPQASGNLSSLPSKWNLTVKKACK